MLQKLHDERRVAASAADTSTNDTPSSTTSRETQTWKGIICSYCSKTHKIINNRLFKDFVQCQAHDGLCISSQAYEELKCRFASLKEAIRVRETLHENLTERTEIITLRATLRQAQLQLEHLQRKNQHGQYCLETLQRIVCKLAADPRDVVGNDDRGDLAVSADEQRWIDQILAKYCASGLQQSTKSCGG